MTDSASSSPTLLSVSPIIPGGSDLDATLNFYEQKMGFKIVYRDATPATFAVVRRDEATVLLQKSDDKHWADQTSFRIAVRNVDAPKIDRGNVPLTVPAVTGPLAYVRFHGRNAATWNARGGSAAERFDYLYPREELREWVEPLRELAGEAEQAFALFNNNSSSPRPGAELQRVAQAAYNAYELRGLLDEAGVPASGGLEPVAR